MKIKLENVQKLLKQKKMRRNTFKCSEKKCKKNFLTNAINMIFLHFFHLIILLRWSKCGTFKCITPHLILFQTFFEIFKLIFSWYTKQSFPIFNPINVKGIPLTKASYNQHRLRSSNYHFKVFGMTRTRTWDLPIQILVSYNWAKSEV